MSAVFADTFYYLAFLNVRDVWHARAKELSRTLSRPIVTTAWVLTEFADGLSTPRHRRAFLDLVASLRRAPGCRVVPATESLFDAGVEFYGQRLDKDWSLTDCISFVVMRQHGIAEALTGDHHFEQAGFTILFK